MEFSLKTICEFSYDHDSGGEEGSWRRRKEEETNKEENKKKDGVMGRERAMDLFVDGMST